MFTVDSNGNQTIITSKNPRVFGLQAIVYRSLNKKKIKNTTSLVLSFESPIATEELDELLTFIKKNLPTLKKLSIDHLKIAAGSYGSEAKERATETVLQKQCYLIASFLYNQPTILDLTIPSYMQKALLGAIHIEKLTILGYSTRDLILFLQLLPKLKRINLTEYHPELEQPLIKLVWTNEKLSITSPLNLQPYSSFLQSMLAIEETKAILRTVAKAQLRMKHQLPPEILEMIARFLLPKPMIQHRVLSMPLTPTTQKAILDQKLEIPQEYINALGNIGSTKAPTRLIERYEYIYDLLHSGLYRTTEGQWFEEDAYFPDLGFADFLSLFLFPILIGITKLAYCAFELIEPHVNQSFLGFIGTCFMLPILYFLMAVAATAILKQIIIGITLAVLTPFILMAHGFSTLRHNHLRNDHSQNIISSQSIFKVPKYPSKPKPEPDDIHTVGIVV